ncbi:hypothetical protein JCM1840_000638 [Sporobolomyces johnsonii]
MAQESAPPLRVAVVGGGIAGLTAALAILHHIAQGANLSLQVFEAAEKFAEIGAGVAFGPNAQRALRLIGVGDALDSVAGPPGDDPDTWFEFRVGDQGANAGKAFTTLTGKDAARGSVHRADFLDQLIKKLPPDLAHFHHRAESYTPHSSGVTIHFQQQDAKDVEADILICSDGIKSQLRAHMYQRKGLDMASQKARYAEWIAWRGLISKAKFHEVFGESANDKMMHVGTKAHILHFPVRNGDLINIVGFVRDEEHKKLGDHTGPWSEPRPASEMLEDYDHFNDECKALLKAIENPSIWGIFALPALEVAVDDRTVLIGDAAHATTPHQGAGAGQAVEDSLFLAAILAHPSVASAPLSSRSSAIDRALSIYQTERHPRAKKVQTTSHEAGMLYEFLDPQAGSDLDKIKANLETRMKWIWEFDIEAEIKRMLQLLETGDR